MGETIREIYTHELRKDVCINICINVWSNQISSDYGKFEMTKGFNSKLFPTMEGMELLQNTVCILNVS